MNTTTGHTANIFCVKFMPTTGTAAAEDRSVCQQLARRHFFFHSVAHDSMSPTLHGHMQGFCTDNSSSDSERQLAARCAALDVKIDSVIECYTEHRPFGEPTKGSLGKATPNRNKMTMIMTMIQS